MVESLNTTPDPDRHAKHMQTLSCILYQDAVAKRAPAWRVDRGSRPRTVQSRLQQKVVAPGSTATVMEKGKHSNWSH